MDAPPPLPGEGSGHGRHPEQPERQSYYEQQSVDTRPCPSCGGQFVFNIEAQRLVCPHCGTSEDIVHGAEAAVVEQQFRPDVQGLAGAMSPRMQSAMEGEKEVVCQNCGGHTTFTGTLTATRCPYCATPIQRTDVHDAPERIAVDGVLPFAVSQDHGSDIVKAWIAKRWFAPNEFKKYSRAGSFQSVYAAYFTFDADATTDYRGQRGDNYTRTVRDGDKTRTVTEIRWRSASGRVFDSFDDLTVLANTGFEDRLVKRLEPWPTTNQLQPFHRDYLAGHLARTYDRGIDHCFADARHEMDDTIDHTIRRDIGGDHQRIHHKRTHLANVTYKHVLLPIWLLTVIYADKPLQVFINGATGEVHGERPWSIPKIIAAVVAALIVLALAIYLYSVFGGGSE
jgi:predicted RNA-binding Zn-ribbon protein involved in translation (DUF1610 family)